MSELPRTKVAGDSMWPTLRTGDWVQFSPATVFSPGAVVLAKLPSGIVAHRLVRAASGKVLLRGDNCLAADPEIDMSSVLGKVKWVRRNGRDIPIEQLDWGRTRLGAWRARLWQFFRRVKAKVS